MGDHVAELAVRDQPHGPDPEAGRQEAVEGGRRAAALEVAENHTPALSAGPVLQLVRYSLTDPTQPHLSDPAFAGGAGDQLAIRPPGSFRHHDQGEGTPGRLAL